MTSTNKVNASSGTKRMGKNAAQRNSAKVMKSFIYGLFSYQIPISVIVLNYKPIQSLIIRLAYSNDICQDLGIYGSMEVAERI